jgi:hypothetical protein
MTRKRAFPLVTASGLCESRCLRDFAIEIFRRISAQSSAVVHSGHIKNRTVDSYPQSGQIQVTS